MDVEWFINSGKVFYIEKWQNSKTDSKILLWQLFIYFDKILIDDNILKDHRLYIYCKIKGSI